MIASSTGGRRRGRSLFCCHCGHFHAEPCPSPPTIALRCSEIRSGWSDEDYVLHARATPTVGRGGPPLESAVEAPHVGFINAGFVSMSTPVILPYFEPGKPDEPDD